MIRRKSLKEKTVVEKTRKSDYQNYQQVSYTGKVNAHYV